MIERFFLLIILFLPTQVWSAAVEGRVVYDETPVAGIRVQAYHNLDYSADPLAVSAPTGDDGFYRLDLPAGEYVLYARDPQRALFAYCGRIPVAVGTESVWAGLQAVPDVPAGGRTYDDEYSAAVEGVLLYDGKPLDGAYLHLYLDSDNDLKGQGYRISTPTGPDGVFAFDGLPESDYYLVARKRATGERVGPILEGDYLALYPHLLPAVAGKVTTVRLQAVRKVKDDEGVAAAGTVVTGIVTDAEGNPLQGLHVFAYTDRVIGHQRPEAISSPTASDGRFLLRFSEGGTYYVGARQNYGDSPAPGELFGMYDETADHSLTVESGARVEDVKIVVEPITLGM